MLLQAGSVTEYSSKFFKTQAGPGDTNYFIQWHSIEKEWSYESFLIETHLPQLTWP